MKCSMFVKALILLLLCIFSSASGKVFFEKTILLEFKNSVSDPSGILSSWHRNSSSHCSWFGISCSSESRVISVNITGGDLSEGNKQTFSSCSKFSQFPFYGFGTRKRACLHGNGKLAGKLSPLFGKLSELRVLSLAFNDFSGKIPVGIWGLEKLEVLDLEGNLLNGRLPNEFLGLRKLRVLNLGFNRIGGEIPSFLKKCEGLEVLNLAGNKLKGSIPGFVGDFLKLRVLYLSYNELNGSIPSELGSNCPYLEHLDLSGNFLVGRIPGSLGKCRQLRTLLLFSNMLIDSIPRELGRLRNLEVLDVSRNRLDGLIPAEIGNCVELSVIVLSNLFDPLPIGSNTRGELSVGLSSPCGDNNSFHGSIPMEITTLSKLRIVWAPKVNLEGKLPRSWGACESLEMLNLAQNLLRGELVGVFDRCKRLHFIDLSSNELSGKLDVKLQVPCMTLFDVSGNHMSGSIPKFDDYVCPQLPLLSSDLLQTCNPSFTYMSYFMNKARLGTPLLSSAVRLVMIHNFSWNNFTGPIHWLPVAPERLGRQTDYAFLAGANKLTGSFPGSLFGKCNKLHGMIANLSNNNIVGHIPLNIGFMCKSLRVLDVSQNHISGIVPQSLGNLKSLVLLDLSGNRLQGQVPDSLHRLKYLRHLSLAGNNLTGGIPSSIGRLRSLEVSELSSNSLSGEVPEDVAKLRNLTALLLNNNKLSGHIPSGLAHVRLLSTFNASFNNLSSSFPWNGTVMNCSGVVGNPLLVSRRILSVAISPSEHNSTYENSQNSITASTGSRTEDHGINSIEIASIVSASAILSVLLVLVILFFYTRKWVPDSRVQGSESRELTLFVDTGVPLTYESIVQATGNFNSRNCIGSGGFGATYKAEISPGILVAVKRLSIGRFHGVQQFHAEIKTLGSVRHPNLVTLIGYQASENEMFLIYNYLPGGNLENFIKERSARAVEWRILHKIALDIASALAYLHDQCAPRVLHRDVKPSNILLDDNFNAYLSDFGLSRLLGTSETHATTGVAGTFGYVAPEYALTCRVSEKADVYSYGVMLLELISDKKALDPSFSSQANGFNIISWAWMLLRQGQAKDVFTSGLWDTGPHDDLVDMLHLALRCTVDTLSTRPTMKQVVQSLKQIQPVSS